MAQTHHVLANMSTTGGTGPACEAYHKRLALLLASKRRDSYASVHKNQSQVYLAKKYSDGYQRSQKEVDKIQDYTNKSTVL